MEIDAKLRRELTKKFEMELNKKEIEVTENWRKELDVIYRKKYENVNSLFIEIKNLMDRMNNRAKILTSIVKEG
jgi:DNA-binding transcriptional regulator/RsmH inhibitor MraZ